MPTLDPSTLEYIITHVFMPLRLPDGHDYSFENETALAEAVCASMHAYGQHISVTDLPQWTRISKMLTTTMRCLSLEYREVVSQMKEMALGDVVAYLIRGQNAAVILRKQEERTVFESFEVSPMAGAVMGARGKLVCSYPGPAISIPNELFNDEDFRSELAGFLSQMNKDVLATHQTFKFTVVDEQDSTHPRYITELLTGILRGVGLPADVQRISKRIADDVVCNNSRIPWRRSPLWLVFRVALQTTLEQTTLGREAYKAFMLFFMHQLTQKGLEEDMASELLHFMSAKLSRRLMKLGTYAPEWLSQEVLDTTESIQQTLRERWEQVLQVQAVSPYWAPSELDLFQDTQLSLTDSMAYVSDVLADKHTVSPSSCFQPQHRRRGTLDEFLSLDGKFFDDAYRAEPHLTLYDFEWAVAHGIDDWVARITGPDADRACEKLERLAAMYSSGAWKIYEGNPEDTSLMLLTLVELWVALDKIVVKCIPILEDYSPEIPIALLENLLLRKAQSFERLRLVYQYISDRHSRVQPEWSVFSDTADIHSFAVRYYNDSPLLQGLKSKIEQAARHDREIKLIELAEKNARHAELAWLAERDDHEYYDDGRGNRDHADWCSKCKRKQEIDGMWIEIHEWPLPDEPYRASIVLFELECPIAFDLWRSATLHLLSDACSSCPEPSLRLNPGTILETYPPLRPYCHKHPRARVTLASNTKRFTRPRSIHIPSAEADVCVNNDLQLFGFDGGAHISTASAFRNVNFSRQCTYQLQGGPYQNLQEYVRSTSHTPNSVLANQADCHQDLSIHEFIAFGNLRSGPLLQWLNLFRELRDRALSFRRYEVHCLVAQAVCQVGPLSSTGDWTWHHELQNVSFCLTLLEELENLVSDIEANWLESATMSTVSFLITRVLASSSDAEVSHRAYGLLRLVRKKAFSWVQELSGKLRGVDDEVENKELRWRLCDASAICRSTFDVDPAHCGELLKSPDDIDILVSCAIFVHDNIPPQFNSMPGASKLLVARDRRLSWTLEGILSSLIRESDEGIHRAVSGIWSSYQRGSSWEQAEYPNSRWFSCWTTSQHPQRVGFNLIDGALLVDGKPLGILPPDITRHGLYQLVFGNRVLNVIPGSIPGMEFSTRDLIFERWRVHFSMKGTQLTIKAQEIGESAVLDLIPQEVLQPDLPTPLVTNHVHWLDPTTGTIEIRPLSRLWEQSEDNWKIHLFSGSHFAQKGASKLIDLHSRTWKMISDCLEPLEHPHNLLIIATDDQVSVDLPRYGLSFFIEDGELHSRDFRGMVYDIHRSTGTMIGLVNQLVLRPNSQLAEEHLSRHVLIPDGKICFTSDGHHVQVTIKTDDLERVTCRSYKVDTDMGCLTGKGSLTDKLFQAYLHALTSSPYGVDLLTKMTGTEQALEILRSAGCRSFMGISCRDAELLCLIGSLVPERTWYSAYLKQMQKVEWKCLPAAAQHHGLYVAARSMKEIHEKSQLFEGESQPISLQGFPNRELHLLERAALRAAQLHPLQFAGLLPSRNCDNLYNSRDMVDSSPAEHRAYKVALSVCDWSPRQDTHENVLELLKSWKSPLAGRASNLSLTYSKEWLSPDLRKTWLPIYSLCRQSDPSQRFKLLFSLAAMGYGSPEHANLIPTLLAFATVPEFKLIGDPPPYEEYSLFEGSRPTLDQLRQCVRDCAHRFKESPESGESGIPRDIGESISEWETRQCSAYNKRLEEDMYSAATILDSSWPHKTPPTLSLSASSYNLNLLTAKLERLFSSCFRNMELEGYLTRVQEVLNESRDSSLPTKQGYYAFKRCSHVSASRFPVISLNELLTRDAPVPLARPNRTLPRAHTSLKQLFSESGKLTCLISALRSNSGNHFQSKYVEDLCKSEEHLKEDLSACFPDDLPCTIDVLVQYYQQNRRRFLKRLGAIKRRLGPQSLHDHLIYNCGQWPPITAKVLLRCIASSSAISLSGGWRKCLISLACLGLELQRSRRLLSLAAGNHVEEFYKELVNEGSDGWNAGEHPDWLLIQLEGNFLIRPMQANVAFEMIHPQSGSNTAQQLNMGEGKSSVIVPIAVSTLADGNKLVRVVVPKALMTQTFRLLVERLGGLANRRIYYLPFSRSIKPDAAQAQMLHNIMQECMDEKGILVVQPDHILSLKLMSVEKQFSHADKLASILLESQRWLHAHTRDVLDESDEILNVRYQLVYTIGLQNHLEGFPERWTTTQQLLGLVRKHAIAIHEKFPFGIELEDGPLPSAFPSIRILHEDAGQELLSRVTEDVVDGLLPNFNFEKVPSRLQRAVHDFISVADAEIPNVQMVTDYSQNNSLWHGLLHLRGLLASGILQFALKERRWRVDYGLDPSRTMLAVPYRAKDVPALRAEFGHPDIAVVLTCLSYYYKGLTKDQLMTAFGILLKDDNPALEYESWIRGCPYIPNTLQRVSGLNIQSTEQWRKDLFPLFSRNKAVIDFYLSQVVFPKEAKEFPSKLSCSGWDLAETRNHLTTGFSGTNDGRYLLPTSITQRDPDHQRSTNAKVLAYLLQPENNYYQSSALDNGERRTARQFLEMVVSQQPEVRVLLDVGAQMLELENRELAITWLELKTDARAAIYFDEDELWVRARDGTTQLFLSSPFAQQLDECIVYLDDAHTRGTDIKFPIGFRAAVTLGPKVTKDRLAQGCMRMRKLGHGHSVMFFAPREVDQSIRAAVSKNELDPIDVMDILRWTILETCGDIEQRAPQWAQQGVDHTSRHDAWSKFCRREISSGELTEVWCQSEAKSLEELYAPDGPRRSFALTVPEIQQRCSDLGILSFAGTGMDEEQEREIVHEAECERHVKRPPRLPAAEHRVDPAVEKLVQSGIVIPGSTAFHPVFDSLANTSAVFAESHIWTQSVFATTDYCNTVVASEDSKVDDYLRPVNWILSTRVGWKQTLVILSPYEVNELLPKIRTSKRVHLHLYTPRTSEAMKPCDDLRFYCIPPVSARWFADPAVTEPLNVFAGQLYLGSYEMYIQLCRFLCIYAGDLEEDGDITIENGGFIPPEHRPLRAQVSNSFSQTPISALKALVSLRRKGMRFGPTHVGKILSGRQLREEDF